MINIVYYLKKIEDVKNPKIIFRDKYYYFFKNKVYKNNLDTLIEDSETYIYKGDAKFLNKIKKIDYRYIINLDYSKEVQIEYKSYFKFKLILDLSPKSIIFNLILLPYIIFELMINFFNFNFLKKKIITYV